MIEKINWYFIKNNVYLQGYDYNLYYMITYGYVLYVYNSIESLSKPIKSLKLNKEQIKYIKNIKKTCNEYASYEDAIKYFNRNKIINSIIND